MINKKKGARNTKKKIEQKCQKIPKKSKQKKKRRTIQNIEIALIVSLHHNTNNGGET